MPASQSESLAGAIPGATLHMAHWGGHSVNVTDPAWFNAALMAFLSALP